VYCRSTFLLKTSIEQEQFHKEKSMQSSHTFLAFSTISFDSSAIRHSKQDYITIHIYQIIQKLNKFKLRPTMKPTFLLLTMSSLALSAPLGHNKGAPYIPLINSTIYSWPNFSGTSRTYTVDFDTCTPVNDLWMASIEVAHSNHWAFFSTANCGGQVIHIGNEDGSADREGDLIKLLAPGDQPVGLGLAGSVPIHSARCFYTTDIDPSHIV
jgi:hypothetical protein